MAQISLRLERLTTTDAICGKVGLTATTGRGFGEGAVAMRCFLQTVRRLVADACQIVAEYVIGLDLLGTDPRSEIIPPCVAAAPPLADAFMRLNQVKALEELTGERLRPRPALRAEIQSVRLPHATMGQEVSDEERHP